MTHTRKRLLSLLLSLCMLVGLMPAALAAVPTATAYIRDTDGVDSGAVYAIYTNEDGAGGSNRILYHTGTGKTDKVTASVSGDELALNGGFDASRQLWTITSVEGGYTVQSVDSGYYLDLSQASTSNFATSTEAVVLTINFNGETGLYTIASGDSYLSFNSSGNTVFLTGSTGYGLRFFKQTEVAADTVEREELIPQPGTTQGEPFAPGTGGSNNFRIPSIITLDSGRIVAAIDARWNHLGDACALDTIVSYSDDGGQTWNYSFPNYFGDSVDSKQANATAFIDPVMIQGNDGTIYLMVDLFPGGVALNTAPMAPAKSSGYVEIDGVQRLVLYTSPKVSEQNDTNYTAYVGDFADGYAKIYDVDGAATEYYADDHYYLYKGDGSDPDAQKIYCQRLGSSEYIQQNVFFYNADLHVRCATYLWLVTSTDGGQTWSAPTILNPQIRTGEDQFYGVGPGAGLCLEDGTIMLPAYTFTSGIANSNQIASFIYSSDGGETWHRSDNATPSNHWSSESCLVQIDETTVRHFYRDGYSTLYYTDHTWNGEKWVAGDPVDTGVHKTYNNQLSAIRYSGEINGKPVILVSTAAGNANSRTNGMIYTFLLNEDKTMELANTYAVTASGESYGYSSLTELEDGSISLLYEGAGSRSVYVNIPASTDLLGDDWRPADDLTSISLDQSVVDLKVGETATLTATYTPADGKVSWTSSNPDVVTVDGGVVTAVASGTATITVSVTSAGYTSTASADVAVQGEDEVVLPDRYTDEVEEIYHETATTYELDTDGIDSGAVYAIFHTGSSRILYHASGNANSDHVTGSASDGLLKLDSGYAATRQTWTVTGNAETGYAIQSCESDGRYLNLNEATSAGSTVPVTDEKQSLTIASVDGPAGSYTVSRVVNGQTLYLAHENSTKQHHVSTEPVSFQFYRQVVTPAHNTYATSVTGLEALIDDLSALDSDEYTSSSWAVLQDALAAAQEAAESEAFDTEVDAQAAQAVIDQAAEDLYAAKLALVEAGGSTSSGGSSSYAITVEDSDNGTVTSSRKSASRGATVTLTAKADEGYQLDTLTVTDKNGTEIKLTDKGDGKYTFTMPSSAVTVTAVFAEDDAPVETGLPFTDVKDGDWFYEAVKYAYDNKLMNGTSATTFAPLTTTSRSMVVTVLWRLAGSPQCDAAPAFPDVASGSWYTDAVAWASENGIVTGYSSGSFGPDDIVTREQLATILYRYVQHTGGGFQGAWAFPLDYADAAQVSDWAYEAMCWCTMKGIISGVGGNRLNPQGSATRAEVAQILMNFSSIDPS